MSDTATAPAAPKEEKTNLKIGDMILAAIKNMKQRKGSSVQAIKKYIAIKYNVYAEEQRTAIYFKKYLRSAVKSGSLVQIKGKGATGSFKLAKTSGKPSATKKRAKASKPAVPKAKKTKSTTGSKPAPAARKSASIVPKKAPAKPKAAKPASGDSKSKKTTKTPTQKPKAPKPKIASPTKSPKKAATKKK